MSLKVREPTTILPEYSLTGDLISFLTCGLQYRLYKRGALAASSPVELWFGEFVHGVMEQAYNDWKAGSLPPFPWAWDPTVRSIEVLIAQQLAAKGLQPHPRLYCRHTAPGKAFTCGDGNHPHQLLVSRRTHAMLNTWGPHLFPLITEAEVKLQGLRSMPSYTKGVSRSPHYSVTGVIDVVSSVSLKNTSAGNEILRALEKDPEVARLVAAAGADFEVIIDYKGMRRPPHVTGGSWEHHEWQVLTYAWLRGLLPNAKPIVAGILFYINELDLSGEDVDKLRGELADGTLDIKPTPTEEAALKAWAPGKPSPLGDTTRRARSIRVIPTGPAAVQSALGNFDGQVDGIETCIRNETRGQNILRAWPAIVDPTNCVVCDFQTFCPKSPYVHAPKVP